MKKNGERGRTVRERNTVEVMIALYCSMHHPGGALCPDCSELREYALACLARCPFGEGKPTCRNCRVHCYRPPMRERIGAVMRFSGPRMIRRHPVLAVRHLVDNYLDTFRQKKA